MEGIEFLFGICVIFGGMVAIWAMCVIYSIGEFMGRRDEAIRRELARKSTQRFIEEDDENT